MPLDGPNKAATGDRLADRWRAIRRHPGLDDGGILPKARRGGPAALARQRGRADLASRGLRPQLRLAAITPLDFGAPDSLEYRRSPLFVLNQTAREVRYRLDDPETARFPFFDDMRTEGVTDYLALPLKFSDGVTHSSSFTTAPSVA